MAEFLTHLGTLAVIAQDNIDTDRIIPARYLTRISRNGYGELLFHDVRSREFPLDQPAARGASILVVGTNFGCGSSREHAVWAIQQAGFRVVIARNEPTSPGYSDIFRQNGANCGLLLAEVDADGHHALVAAGSGAAAEVNLEAESVQVAGQRIPFAIDPVTKSALLRGLDLIGTTLEFEAEISQFEKISSTFAPSK